MTITNLLFYVFSLGLVLSAFMVILSKHPIFSLVFLIVSFLFASFLLFLLECEFLALIFLIIYVGAVAVLFLFAVMMLEAKSSDLSRNVIKYLPVGVFFGILFFLPFLMEGRSNIRPKPSFNFYLNNYQNWYDLVDSVTDIEAYGKFLYSFFAVHILVAGLILLLVLIGVVYLTKTYKVDEKISSQSSFKQLARESKFFFNK